MDVSSLPDDPKELKALLLKRHEQIAQLEADRAQQIAQKDQRIAELQELIAYLRRKMYGPRSERINDNQLLLFGQSVMPVTSPPQENPPVEVKANRPRGHGRRLIPANLPREEVVIDVPDDQKPCPECHSARERIGEEVSEQLEFIPAKLFVRKFVRAKYACGKCEAHVVTAEKPQQVVEKGLAGPGLIAHVATAKYADHLPLYRIEGIFARYGIELSRSTMCDWMRDVAQLARPLVELMRKRILQSCVIHTDDTTVPVQDEGRTRTGRLWVYVGDVLNPYAVFEYTPDRKKEHPQKWLEHYGGYLQADAYGGYDEVYSNGKVIEVACWAHARRKFFDARDTARPVCDEALKRIKALYEVEEQARGLDDQGRLALRRHKSVALLDEMEQWLRRTAGELLPKSPAAGAITYTLNQWDALRRYTEAGFLNIDNNPAERELRPVALGRKNWLFAGSDEGGRTAATIYSLIQSARRHELNVEYYLRSIFAHLPGAKHSELHHLLPDVWKKELANEEAAARKPSM